MSKTGGNIFEQHIEKAVLAAIGLLCIWVLITRVFVSPNKVAYDHRKLGPSQIDPYISKQADGLEKQLSGKTGPDDPYDPRLDEFIAKIDLSIPNINVSLGWPLPPCRSKNFRHNGKYRLPRLVEVGEAVAEHIRAVAYVPTIEIDKENIYDEDNSEPNDVDFVTVESTIAIDQLVKNFYECFAGEEVPEEWRDPCLAKPVFAAVQLQRRELLANGGWSDWQTVPRSKIDHRKKMFQIVEDVKQLPAGGVQVRLLNFDNKQVMIDLLQPEAYRIASADEEWFSPSIHKEYAKYQKEREAEEKREALEAKRKKHQEERERLRRERSGIVPGRMSNPGRISERDEEFSGGRRPREMWRGSGRDRRRGPGGRRGNVGGQRETEGELAAMKRMRGGDTSKKKPGEKGKGLLEIKSIKDFYDEYNEMLITAKTDIAKMDEPLVFWSHDDIVEPGKSYRYRIRLGVFNPIADTEQVSEQDEHLKDQVILWSDFSDETETVEIPSRLYFFPQSIQEIAKTVRVKVCRYVLGYWYSENFRVSQGEVIGAVRAVEPESAEGAEQDKKMAEVTIPETIDYSTGAMYVDAVRVNNWTGGRHMRAMSYHDMLYTFDGTSIERVPISRSYWAAELQIKFNEIDELEQRPKKPWRDWGSKTADYRRRGPKRGAGEFEDEEDRERAAAARMRGE